MTLHIASQWCARPGHAEGRSPVKSYSYRERDYAFGQLILTLRTRIGLTQEGLGERLGVSRRAVAHWEAGLNYPDIEHLQALIALGVQQRIFPAGQEAEEIRALWRAAHQKVLLDEAWLASVLGRTRPALTLMPLCRWRNPDQVSCPRLSQSLRHDWIGGRRWRCPASMIASRNWRRWRVGWSRRAVGW